MYYPHHFLPWTNFVSIIIDPTISLTTKLFYPQKCWLPKFFDPPSFFSLIFIFFSQIQKFRHKSKHTRRETRRAFDSVQSCKIWVGVIVTVIVIVVPGVKQFCKINIRKSIWSSSLTLLCTAYLFLLTCEGGNPPLLNNLLMVDFLWYHPINIYSPL